MELYTKFLVMKVIYKSILTVLFALVVSTGYAQTGTALTAAEFEKGINNKDSVELLDVRTAGEFNGGHLKNALWADWKDENEFTRRIGFIDKQKPVYVYCLAGSRSAAAAAKMRSMGFQHVYELKGGINAWKTENRAVEGRLNEKQMSTGEFNAAINNAKFVLVDFGAEWCPPCKKMEPVLKSLQRSNPNKFTLVKVDGGKDADLLKEYNVTSLPVFLLFKDGKQVWRKEGVVEESEIARLLN